MIILQNVTLCFRLSCCHHDDAPDCAGRLYLRVVVVVVGILRQAKRGQIVVLGQRAPEP